MRYAQKTTVSSERSQAEIARLVARYGAANYMYGWSTDAAVVQFSVHGRSVKFRLPLPDKDSDEFRYTPEKRRRRSDDASYKAWEQATRQRWRALALCIQAKLEAVESGITTFDEEFLAHILLADGSTVGEQVVPRVEDAYQLDGMPTPQFLLTTGGRKER